MAVLHIVGCKFFTSKNIDKIDKTLDSSNFFLSLPNSMAKVVPATIS